MPPIGDLPGGGTIDANGFQTTIAQGITGAGGLTVTDSSGTGAGEVILDAVNPYAGPTNVLAGVLAIGDSAHPSAALSGGGPVSVAAGATLGGYGSVSGNVTSMGTVAVADATPGFGGGPTGTFTVGGAFDNEGVAQIAGADIGNVLAVQGDYSTGAGAGTVVLQTLLNQGGPLSNQSTDRLLIFGSAAGNTTVEVKAIGHGANTTPNKPSATTGISIIQVAGAVISRGLHVIGRICRWRHALSISSLCLWPGFAERKRIGGDKTLSAIPARTGTTAGKRLYLAWLRSNRSVPRWRRRFQAISRCRPRCSTRVSRISTVCTGASARSATIRPSTPARRAKFSFAAMATASITPLIAASTISATTRLKITRRHNLGATGSLTTIPTARCAWGLPASSAN